MTEDKKEKNDYDFDRSKGQRACCRTCFDCGRGVMKLSKNDLRKESENDQMQQTQTSRNRNLSIL